MIWTPGHSSDLSCVWLSTQTPFGKFTIELIHETGKYRMGVSTTDDIDDDFWVENLEDDEPYIFDSVEEAQSHVIPCLENYIRELREEADKQISEIQEYLDVELGRKPLKAAKKPAKKAPAKKKPKTRR